MASNHYNVYMKKRFIISIFAFSLLSALPTWGQTRVIKRDKQTVSKSAKPQKLQDIPRIKKNGLTYEIHPNDCASIVNDYDDHTKLSGKVVVPAYISYNGRNYPVTCIDRSFPSAVTTIVVPAGVDNLWGLTYYRQSWKTVEIDTNNQHFSSWESALFDKNQTTLLKVSEIVSGTFEIPSSVVKIKGKAFSWCHNLESVIIPASVTTIGNKAFEFCFSLTSVSILSTIREIGDYAFQHDSALVSVVLPKTIEKMGRKVFEYCSKLKSVQLPEGVKSISDYEFYKCTSLSSVYVPDGVESIRQNAFSSCKSLNEVSIPSSLIENIEEGAFNTCDKLESLTVRYPNGTTKKMLLKEIPFKAK